MYLRGLLNDTVCNLETEQSGTVSQSAVIAAQFHMFCKKYHEECRPVVLVFIVHHLLINNLYINVLLTLHHPVYRHSETNVMHF
jgi:hypothetical protein